ncbi:hypothetical protein SASPL_133369 [Salvia splendens]|uniref:Uncharacterized protein n=1 Tax=Salvia splendens TaxID=180675 RepID=A0A8X8X2U2_SALSN|nr:hypothetical protein SASPL_133369 [Salvia splendens]
MGNPHHWSHKVWTSAAEPNLRFLQSAFAISTNDDKVTLGALVSKMRDSIVKIDDDYINRMRGDSGYYQNLQNMWTEEYAQEFDILPISSLCGHNLLISDGGSHCG